MKEFKIIATTILVDIMKKTIQIGEGAIEQLEEIMND